MSSNLQKAKMRTVLMQPFFSSFIINRKIVEGDSPFGTAHTDGKSITFHPDFVKNTPTDQLMGVIVHEVLHIVNFHLSRIGTRNPELWNIACDYAINPIVKSNGFKLPENHLDEARFHGMNAEKIYEIILSEAKPTFYNFGSFQSVSISESEAEELKSEIISAATAAKMRGRLPLGMDRIFDELLEPKVNWRQVLASFLKSTVGSDDYSYQRSNRRYPDIYLPIINTAVGGKILFGIDTSGSIQNEELKIFISELDDIRRKFRADVTLAWCDTKVNVQEFTADEEIDYKPKGGGGTSFVPVFEYAESHDCIVYFTDGLCSEFPDPHENTLWVVNGDKFNPPFGEVIYINE